MRSQRILVLRVIVLVWHAREVVRIVLVGRLPLRCLVIDHTLVVSGLLRLLMHGLLLVLMVLTTVRGIYPLLILDLAVPLHLPKRLRVVERRGRTNHER